MSNLPIIVRRGFLAFLGVGLLAMPGAAFTPHGNQTLSSGPNVYRVELRDLGPLRVLSTGERSNDTGELHKIEVSLESGGQIDGFTETSTTIRGASRYGESGFVEIDLNDQLEFNTERLPNGASHNLWIHARKNGDGFPTTVTLKIKATELDCIGQSVCDSGNIGTFSLTFDLPTFRTPPPRTCGPTNSYRIGHNLPEGGMIDGLRNNSNYSGGSFGRGGILAQGQAPRVNLQPTTGTICIASTHKPATYIRNTPDPRNTSRPNCLSLPFGDVPGEAQVSVPECWINTNTDRDRKAQWRISRKSGSDFWSVKNIVSNHCLNAKASQIGTAGGPVRGVGCSAHRDQSWRKTARGNSYVLQNVATNQCLTNEDGRAMVRPCSNLSTQIWTSINEY